MGDGETASTREQRLARQLKANIARRKAQARAMTDSASGEIPADEGAQALPKAPHGG